MAEIGAALREARIRARVDMSEVENRTKIRAKYLRAIENEEWDLLPGPVYAKSFLRAYGDFLGLDSRMLVEEYKRRYEQPTDHESPRPVASLAHERERGRERRPRRALVPRWASIVLVIVAVAVALYLVGTLGARRPKPPTPAGLRAGAPRPRPRPIHRPLAPPAKPWNATLQMTPTGPVYVCLVNARGRYLIYEKTYTAGETIPIERGHRLLLTLGNANIQLKVDGHPVPVAQSPTAIRLQITPEGVKHIPMSQTPTCP